MQKLVLVAASLVALTLTGFEVRADGAWCARDVKGETNCGFHTYQQCMANLSGIGGVCDRNLNYQASKPDRAPRKSRGN
jgi:uncharacterized protein DUF3551